MKKILIAEDDRVFSMRLAKALERHGDLLDIIQVENGQEAMDVLEKHRVSLLVTDINMPEVDGFELLAHVNAHYPVVPCFVMTAIGELEVKPKLPRDLVRFFPKPFKVEAFVAAVLETVGRDIPRGVMRGISVASFCSMIEMEKKTCLFEVQAEEGKPGLLYFDRGELHDAALTGLTGEAAAIQILGQKQAAFKFRDFPNKKISRRIKRSLWTLIDEGLASDAEFGDIDWGQVVSDD